MKEAELQTSQERYLRAKVAEDSSAMVRENSLVTQKCADLEQQIHIVSRRPFCAELGSCSSSSSSCALLMVGLILCFYGYFRACHNCSKIQIVCVQQP